MIVMSLLYIFIMGVMRLLKNSAASPDEAEGVPIGLLLLVLYLLTLLYEIALVQSEQDGHTVSTAHVLTLVLGRNPFGHLLQYTKCFIRQ